MQYLAWKKFITLFQVVSYPPLENAFDVNHLDENITLSDTVNAYSVFGFTVFTVIAVFLSAIRGLAK